MFSRAFSPRLARLAVPAAAWLAAALALAGCFGGLTVHADHYTLRAPDSTGTAGGALRLDGYYFNDRDYALQTLAVAAEGDELVDYYWTEWRTQPDSLIQPVVLWPDGTAASFEGYSGGTYRGWQMQDAGSYAAAHRLFRRHLRTVDGERGFQFPSWGAFRVRDGRIEIQVLRAIHNPGGTIGGGGEYATAIYEGVVESDTSFTITTSAIPEVGLRDTTVRWRYRFRPLDAGAKPPSQNWTQTHEDVP